MSRSRDLADAGSKANFLDNVIQDLNTALVSVEGTEIKSTGESGGSKFLREDGDNSCSWQIVEAIPSGMIAPFGMSSAPSGWLVCDGSAVSRSTYSALFSAISTTWGSGDGSSTFNIPDLKGAYLRGAGTSTAFTQNQTITLAQTLSDQMQGHHHQFFTTGDIGASGGARNAPHTPDTDISSLNIVRDPESDGSNGTPRTGNETRPNSKGVQYMIKI